MNINTYLLRTIIISACALFSSCDYFFPPLSGDKIDVDEAYSYLKKHKADNDVVLIDLRTKEEYDKGHIEGAVLIDFRQADSPKKLEQLDKTKRYILYSKTSTESFMAFELMKELRFENVHSITGGWDAWKSKGLPETL
jgi:rhodanese-related sulfurtransferase